MHSSVRQRRPIRAFDANDTETSLKASTPIVAVGKASAIAVPFRAEAYRGLFARLGGGLIIGTVLSWLVLRALVLSFCTSHPAHALGDTERTAVLMLTCMQLASLLRDATQPHLSENIETRWLSRAILAVKLLAMLTNVEVYMYGSPFVVDSFTGRPNCMLRWAEWTVLAFTLTFTVEALDSETSPRP